MFKGIQKVTLIDFPGVISTTLFTGGCNFRCAWCHNPDLVYPEKVKMIPDIPTEEIEEFLLSRRGKIGGVCVTGGEPTLWADELSAFFAWCKREGFKTKLDTNGYLPSVIRAMLDANLLDFIAMDVKNTFVKYAQTAGLTDMDIEPIKESIDIIKSSGVEHQFRTTVVDGLVGRGEMEAFADELGIEIVYQEYRPV